MSSHAELLQRIQTESQRHYAAFTLFNQAMADTLGLHPTDLQCVGLLALEPEPVSTGQIARLTGLTTGSATRLVDRLENAALVTRQADPQDRRRALVTLAPESTTNVQAAWDVPAAAFAEVLKRYTDDELRLIGDYLHAASEVGRHEAERLTAPNQEPRVS